MLTKTEFNQITAGLNMMDQLEPDQRDQIVDFLTTFVIDNMPVTSNYIGLTQLEHDRNFKNVDAVSTKSMTNTLARRGTDIFNSDNNASTEVSGGLKPEKEVRI